MAFSKYLLSLEDLGVAGIVYDYAFEVVHAGGKMDVYETVLGVLTDYFGKGCTLKNGKIGYRQTAKNKFKMSVSCLRGDWVEGLNRLRADGVGELEQVKSLGRIMQ